MGQIFSGADNRSRRRFLQATGTAATITAAGCLGGGGGAGSESLSVAWMPIYPDMQYFVMQEEGYFDEIDADIEGQLFTDGPSIVQAYASGDIDVAMFGIVPAMIVIDKGISAKVVTSNIEEPMGILAHEDFAAMWDPTDAAGSFQQWEAQTGSKFTFGTFPEGSVPDILLRYWLINEHGLEPGEAANIIGPGGASAVFQGLANGEFDGTSIMEPVPTRTLENDLPYEFISVSGDFMPGQPAAVTLMNDEVRDTQAAIDFVEQHQRATEFIQQNRQTAAGHASTVIGEQSLPVPIAERAMESPLANFTTDPHRIESGTEIFAEYAATLGKTEAQLTTEEIFDYSVYDGLQ